MHFQLFRLFDTLTYRTVDTSTSSLVMGLLALKNWAKLILSFGTVLESHFLSGINKGIWTIDGNGSNFPYNLMSFRIACYLFWNLDWWKLYTFVEAWFWLSIIVKELHLPIHVWINKFCSNTYLQSPLASYLPDITLNHVVDWSKDK